MSWFFIALLAPILFAFVNHLDKYFVTRFKETDEERGVGSLVIYSSLFGLIVCAVLYLFLGNSILISWSEIGVLLFAGVLGVAAVIFYLYAIEKDEASIVAPLFQVIPIFGLVFEYVILGIVPTMLQIIGSLVIITGGIILATEYEGIKPKRMKIDVFLLMLASSLFFSLIAVLFKFATLEGNFWVSTFWEYAGWGLTGIALFIISRTYRTEFISSLKDDGKTLFTLNVFGEFVNTVGNSAKNFAALLVPVTLVYSVEALQPIFILLFGILITLFFPKISEEDISFKALIQKGGSIALMVLGTVLILL